jgi:hypothetical protein
MVQVAEPVVPEVHAREVPKADAVPGDEWFAKTQRTPSEAPAEADPKSESAAKPRNQRRSVVRTSIVRSRSPSPEAAGINPPTIVERRISPRLVLNPGPPPRILVNPVPVRIRRPTGCDCRSPDVAVVRSVAPGSVLVEIIGADNVGRNITGRFGVIEAVVAIACPLIEGVRGGRRMRVDCHRRPIAEANLFVGENPDRRTVSGRFAFATPHGDDGLIAVRVHIKTIIARLQYGERLVGRVHFVFLIVIQVAHMKIQSSLVELKLHEIVGYVSDGKAALRTNARYAGANADFCTRIFVSPNVVGIGERPVDFAGDPIASSLRLHRN